MYANVNVLVNNKILFIIFFIQSKLKFSAFFLNDQNYGHCQLDEPSENTKIRKIGNHSKNRLKLLYINFLNNYIIMFFRFPGILIKRQAICKPFKGFV